MWSSVTCDVLRWLQPTKGHSISQGLFSTSPVRNIRVIFQYRTKWSYWLGKFLSGGFFNASVLSNPALDKSHRKHTVPRQAIIQDASSYLDPITTSLSGEFLLSQGLPPRSTDYEALEVIASFSSLRLTSMCIFGSTHQPQFVCINHPLYQQHHHSHHIVSADTTTCCSYWCTWGGYSYCERRAKDPVVWCRIPGVPLQRTRHLSFVKMVLISVQ